jgi:hypothetical protein
VHACSHGSTHRNDRHSNGEFHYASPSQFRRARDWWGPDDDRRMRHRPGRPAANAATRADRRPGRPVLYARRGDRWPRRPGEESAGRGRQAARSAAVYDYVNRQEAELRRQTAGTGVEVIRSGELLLLRLPASGTFDVGRSEFARRRFPRSMRSGLILKRFNQSLSTCSAIPMRRAPRRRTTPCRRSARNRSRPAANPRRFAARVATGAMAPAIPIADNGTPKSARRQSPGGDQAGAAALGAAQLAARGEENLAAGGRLASPMPPSTSGR